MADIIDYRNQPEGYEPGFYDLDSYEDYAIIPALRSSELKKLRKSPAHYRAAVLHPKSVTPQLQRSFAKGSAFDVLTLHGKEAFDALVTIEPDLNRNTKAYREWKDINAGARCILSHLEKLDIIEMHRCAMLKKCFSDIFAGDGTPHRVIVWQDSTTGLWCKAEIDWICSDGCIVDLKSTADAGFLFFSRNAFRLGYLNQAAHYLSGLTTLTGIKHEQFKFAAVEVEAPYESHVFKATLDQIDRAQFQNEENMAVLLRCLERDEWPGYPDQIVDLDSGQYLFDDYEFEETEDSTYGF